MHPLWKAGAGAVMLAAAVLPAGAQTVSVNGQKVSAKTVVSNGQVYVDAAALMKALGGKAAYNKAAKQLVITLPGAAGQPAAVKTASAGAAGTAQMAGDNGELGKVYTIGKETPLYFTLKSAEFTTDTVSVGDSALAPKADEKLLVLHYSVQNPLKSESFVNWSSLKFTAVDANNVNREYWVSVGDERNKGPLNITLKPAQKVDAYVTITVPAKGVIPKLIVQRDEDVPVLRYDLRDKVKPLAAPIADPADTTGATALAKVPAPAGTYFSLGEFVGRLDKVEYINKALGEEELEEGNRGIVLTVSIKNCCQDEKSFNWATFTPDLRTTDGEQIDFNSTLLLAKADRPAALNLKPGEENQVRYFYQIPKDAKAKSFGIREGDEGRVFEFDLTQMQ